MKPSSETKLVELDNNEEKPIVLKGTKKNTAPKITKKEIVKLIARQSSLTREQVNECFSTYIRVIENFVRMDNVPPNLRIEFPDLGYFTMNEKQGAKAGSEYFMPTIQKKEDGSLTTKRVKYVIEEDRPNYQELKFKVYRSTAKSIREISEEKWIKENGDK